MHYIQSAKEVIKIESQAVLELLERLDDRFSKACQLLLDCKGRVIVLGMGKSGHIGNKIAATLASTGTPAFAINAGEASHGDFGMITRGDVVVAISHSGKTLEIVRLLPLLKKLKIPLISMTGDPDAELAQAAEVNLDVGIQQEACPLGLAPTTSTTVTLVMGDALAIALLKTRGFTEEDFAFSHPGGSLGKRLLLTVGDLMHSGDAVPRVAIDTNLYDSILEVSNKRLGMTCVVGDDGRLAGIFTDGDMRRTFEKGLALNEVLIQDVMTLTPKTIDADQPVVQALDFMNANTITSLAVCDAAEHIVGVLHIHDILRAGIS